MLKARFGYYMILSLCVRPNRHDCTNKLVFIHTSYFGKETSAQVKTLDFFRSVLARQQFAAFGEQSTVLISDNLFGCLPRSLRMNNRLELSPRNTRVVKSELERLWISGTLSRQRDPREHLEDGIFLSTLNVCVALGSFSVILSRTRIVNLLATNTMRGLERS